MDQVQQHQSVQSSMDIQEKDSNIDSGTMIIAFLYSWYQLYEIVLQYGPSIQEVLEIYIKKHCDGKI